MSFIKSPLKDPTESENYFIPNNSVPKQINTLNKLFIEPPPDFLIYLKPCSWKGIQFPIGNISTEMTQDLVEHKYPDRDGSYVESMGRAAIKVKCKAFFLNHVSKGKGENFEFGNLFPKVFQQFIKACKDKSVGLLVHPIHGTFTAKCASISYDLNADVRDGVIVDVEWIECVKNTTSAIDAEDVTELVNLYTDALANLSVDFPKLTKEKSINLFDLADDIGDFVSGVAGALELTGKKVLGKIDRVLYRIERTQNAIRSLNSNTAANALQKGENLYEFVKKQKDEIVSNTQVLYGTGVYVTKQRQTLTQIASLLQNKIFELLKLNKDLGGKPFIEAETPIKYKKNLLNS